MSYIYYVYRFVKMRSIILILLLKLCLAQEYPPYLVSPESDFTRSTKVQNDKSFLYDWKNNFDNNVIIPDA